MNLVFTIGHEIKYETKINMSIYELFPNYIKKSTIENKNTFKIPLNKSQLSSSKRSGKKKYYEEVYDEDSSDSSLEFSEEEEGFNSLEVNNNVSADSSSGKILRKHHRPEIEDIENYLYNPLLGNKKPRKELTEDEINKKNEQIQKRKNHAKRQLEEEKRQTIEKILNEDGRKLRERQRKFNEDSIKKELELEERYKQSLTKIKTKFLNDGTIYVRFPQGLLLPKYLKQKPIEQIKLDVMKNSSKCQVNDCKNLKKYKDPKSQLFYCSVKCFKELRKITNFSNLTVQ